MHLALDKLFTMRVIPNSEQQREAVEAVLTALSGIDEGMRAFAADGGTNLMVEVDGQTVAVEIRATGTVRPGPDFRSS